MEANPYQAPAETAVGVKSGQWDDLRKVAIYQKGIQFCILIYFLVVAAQFALPTDQGPILLMVVIPLLLVVILLLLAATVFVFLLAIQVYKPVLGLLTLVPCIGLIVLLVVNGKATSILKQNGIHVGLLGARMRDFPQRDEAG